MNDCVSDSEPNLIAPDNSSTKTAGPILPHEALLEMVKIGIQQADLDNLLKVLLASACKVLGSQRVVLIFIEPRQLIIGQQSSQNFETEVFPLPNFVLNGQGLNGLALCTGQIAATDDYLQTSSFVHVAEVDKWFAAHGPLASIAIPILVDKQVVALLSTALPGPHQWQPDELEQARTLGVLAAELIGAVWQRQQLNQRNQDLTARNQQLEVLNKISRKLSGLLELNQLAEQAVTSAVEALNAHAGLIHLFYPDRPHGLEFLIWADHLDNTKPPMLLRANNAVAPVIPDWLKQIETGTGLIGSVAASRQTLLVADLNVAIKANPYFTLDPDPTWQSGLFVPLLFQQELVGVLTLLARDPDHFNQTDLAYAELVAATIAGTFKLMAEVKAQRGHDQVDVMQTLARTVAHDLSQPLTVLRAELDFVTTFDEMPGPETIQRMQQAVSTMRDRLRDYQQLSRFVTVETVLGMPIVDYPKSPSNS